MKIAGYLCCMVGLASMISTSEAAGLRNKINRQLYGMFSTEDSSKDKRPFCNAFTGCGKKRSGSPLDNQIESTARIRIPEPIYQAFLRAAGREVSESINRDTSEKKAISDIAIEYPRLT